MAYSVHPDDDVVSLPPTEWKDLSEAEDTLARLARVAGGTGAQSKSITDTESGGPLAEATLFVEASKAPRRRVGLALLGYLLAAGFGVAATLAWQQHGEPMQRILARWIPQLVWPDAAADQAPVPVARQATAVEPVVAEDLPPPPVATAPLVAPAVALAPVGPTASDLADLRRTVERMAVSQEQMAREISSLRAVRPEARPEARPKVSAPVVPQSVAVLPPPPPQPPPPAPLPQRIVPAPPPLD